MTRVLVVDDQPHVVRVIRMALERRGYQVEVAADGQAALEKFRGGPFDVLITDINMPRMDGRALCDAVQSAAAAGKAPFTVIVTGGTDPDVREWAEGLERTHFLEKPLSIKHISALLCEHFEARAAT